MKVVCRRIVKPVIGGAKYLHFYPGLLAGLSLLACTQAQAQVLDQVTRQAEAATLVSAPIEAVTAGYHGTGYVNVPSNGCSLTWSNFDGGPGGGVNVQIRYLLAGSVTREAPVTVNGVARRVRFAPTGTGVWGTVTAFGRFVTGTTNVITLATDGADIGIVDEITVSQPAPVRIPARVYWGGYNGMSQLVGTGTSQWTWVQAHQDGLLLHGAYWGNPAMSPAPSTVAPALATLLKPYKQTHIYEAGFPGQYPLIDSKLGNDWATSATQDVTQVMAWGFSQPDISTDFHLYAWQESMRYHPEWRHDDFFAALCGNWGSYTGAVVSASTYGWFRQWTEKLAQAYPGIRVTACDSPVYFNWDDLRELGDDDNAYGAWVKLERHGTNVEAFWSATGYTWKSLGVATSTLPATAYAGLAVTSKNSARLATAKFNSAQVYNFFFGDIGMPGRGGTLAQGTGTFTLTSYGNHYDGTDDDAYFFVNSDQSGDGEFVARVNTLTNNSKTNRAETAAGIAVRESLASNARVVSLSLRNDSKAQFQTRTATGGAIVTLASPSAVAPSWMKIARTGNLFSAWVSTNGTSYTQVGTTQTVSMASAVKVGLFCDSTIYWENATAQFSYVSFISAAANTASWAGQDIGSTGLAGSQSIGSTISVDAAGSDIAGTNDQFRFVYKPLTGDGTVIAQCYTFADKTSSSTALDPLAKMGVMLRASTNANARHAFACFTPQNGIRQLVRASDGAASATGGVWGVGEAGIVPGLNSNDRRALAHYLTGNDFFTAQRDAFQSTYKPNYVGFTTDSPYEGYMSWGGSETQVDAKKHRQKIRSYEAWLQSNGLEHQLIANSNTGGAAGTQAERDTWDSTYADDSLRSITLHQLEGGRPDKVIFESWYDGPYALVPETKSGSYANLALRGIKYLKGEDQTLDLSVKAAADPLFFGGSLRQSVPGGVQVRSWRAATTNATQTFTVRLKNTGEVDALPVLQAYASGGAGWAVSYFWGTTNVTALITDGDGVALTDSNVERQELIAPNATIDLTVQVAAVSPAAATKVLVRAFWNPQDPNLAVKDAVQLELLPPNTAPVATNAFAAVAPGASVDVDLWTLAADSETSDTSLWFTLTGATNGMAVLQADGHTVRFTPTAGYNGPASFGYAVRDVSADARLLRYYTFEPPDTAADALATDSANRSDGVLTRIGSGTYTYETNAPLRLQAQCLRLVEVNAGSNAQLRTSLPLAEYNLTNSSWTMSMWLKRATRTTTDMAFYIGSGNGSSGDGHELELWCGGNEDKVNLRYWDVTNGLRAMFSSPATVTTGTWHHAAVVWTAAGGGTGTLALFVDGTSCGGTNLTSGFKQTSDLIFGGIASTATDPRAFDGWLDECALYAGALDAAEIARLATLPVTSNAGLASYGSVTVNVDDATNGLLARWPFDGKLADVTGHGWQLTAAGDAAPTNTQRKQGSNSLSLDGSGDYVYTSALSFSNAISLTAWIYVPSNASNIQTVAANSGSGGNTSGFRFYVNSYSSNPGDGKLILETGNGSVGLSVASAVGVIAKDQWQHVAAVINRSAGTATLYRNGTAVITGSIRTDFTNNASLSLGAMGINGFPFRSQMDDVRVYNCGLSSNELAMIINEVNVPPVIGAVTNRMIAVNGNTGPLGIYVNDLETAPLHLALSAASSNTGLVQNAGIVWGGSGTNRTVTVTPVSNSVGSAVITLTVNDGTLATSGTFTVTVTNTPPVIGAVTNRTLSVNTGSGAIGFYVNDAETAPQYLMLSAASSNTGLVQNAGIALGGSGTNRTVTVTPVTNRLGSAVITLTVSDGTLATNGMFTVTVAGSAIETWRFDRFGTTANAGIAADSANPDGDAGTNGDEYILGTDPTVSNAWLTVDSATAVSNGLKITFYARRASGTGYTGLTRYYDVVKKASFSAVSWSNVVGRTGIVGSNQTVTVTLPITGTPAFYRIKVRLP